MDNPDTSQYAKHVYIAPHKGGKNSYAIILYCNGCRSSSQLLWPMDSESELTREFAYKTIVACWAPYARYFVRQGAVPFSEYPAPQPSLPHVFPKSHKDCSSSRTRTRSGPSRTSRTITRMKNEG